MTSDLIRVITNFPKPGIVFKDITPLLQMLRRLMIVVKKLLHMPKMLTTSQELRRVVLF